MTLGDVGESREPSRDPQPGQCEMAGPGTNPGFCYHRQKLELLSNLKKNIEFPKQGRALGCWDAGSGSKGMCGYHTMMLLGSYGPMDVLRAHRCLKGPIV